MDATRKVGVEGVLMAGHKGPAVEVSLDPAAEWGTAQAALGPGRRGYPVEVLLNGVRFRSAIVSRRRRFYVLVDESMARRAGVEIGETIKLTLWANSGFDLEGNRLGRSKSIEPGSTEPSGKRRGSPTRGG